MKIITSTAGFAYFCMYASASAFLDVASTYFLLKTLDSATNGYSWGWEWGWRWEIPFMVVSMAGVLLASRKDKYDRVFRISVSNSFRCKAFSEYKRLNSTTRDKHPFPSYKQIVSEANGYIGTIVLHFPRFAPRIASGIIGVYQILTSNNDGHDSITLIGIITVAFIGFALYIRTRLGELKAARERRKTAEKSKDIEIRIASSRFGSGSIGSDFIGGLMYDRSLYANWTRDLDTDIFRVFGVLTTMITGVILWLKPLNVGLLIGMVDKLVSSIDYGFSVYMELNESQSAYEKYTDFWKENEQFQIEDPPQYPLPKTFTLSAVNILVKKGRADHRIRYFPTRRTGMLSFSIGGKYLIRSPSGAGKSTFIKALLGLIPGVSLTRMAPGNFYSNFVYYDQKIRQNLPWSEVTLRQLFQTDDVDLIQETCNIACVGDLFIRFGADTSLDNSICGGEQSRIALAIKLAELKGSGKRALILDEAEQGLDPPLGYEVFESVMTHFPEVLVIAISHLEHIETRLRWNRIIRIRANGMISI